MLKKNILKQMIKCIEEFQEKKITLIHMHNNLEALFYSIEEPERNEEFINKFHKYWDFVEEIIATDSISKEIKMIENDIIPKFKDYIYSNFVEYDKNNVRIKGIIDSWDPLEFSPYTPIDEYDDEIDKIKEYVDNNQYILNEELLGDKIKFIFEEKYGKVFFKKGKSECILIAKKILITENN